MPVLLYQLLAVIAGFVLLREFRFAMASIRTQRWRLCEGAIETTPAPGSDESLEYSFSIDDKEYRSSQIGFGFPYAPTAVKRTLGGSVLKEALSKAPAVTIYYDPRNPDNSVLFTGIKPFHIVRLSITFVVFFIVALFAFA